MARKPTNGKPRLGDFRPQARNANKHTPRGMGQLEASIQRDGYSTPMVAAADGEVFDGSARLETVGGVMAGAEPIVVHSDGTRPVIHVRDDIPTATDPRAVRLAVAANAVAAHNLDYDAEVLAAILAEDQDALRGILEGDELAAILGQALSDGAGAGNDPIPEQYMVLIECSTEHEQAELLERFSLEGLKCRALIS